MNPYVLIATHQRIDITEKNIRCLLKCDVGVILAVSHKSELHHFKKVFPTIHVTIQDNLPLGRKWQHGVSEAKFLKADPLIINGSDDILSPEFFTITTDLLNDGFHFIGLTSWYVYDLSKIYHFDYLATIPLGGGRVYSGELLRLINYSLFDRGRDRHLDDLSYANVMNSGLNHTTINKPLILSVKGNWPTMNPVHKMFHSKNAKLVETIYNPQPILEKFNI